MDPIKEFFIKATEYFDKDLVNSSIKQIESNHIKHIAYYTSVGQNNGKIFVDLALLTDKAIYDFTLHVNDGLIHDFLPLKSIAKITEKINSDSSIDVLVHNSSGVMLWYMSRSTNSVNELKMFAQTLKKQIISE